MEKIQKQQALVTFMIDITPEELEELASELRMSKPLPGQEMVRKLTTNVSIRYKPDLSTNRYETMRSPQLPKIPIQVGPVSQVEL